MTGFDKVIPSVISEYEVYNVHSTDELIKWASVHIDVPDDFVFDPDFLYLWVRIVSAGEYYGPNKNGDYFPEIELFKYYETFRTAHAFKNHENKNVENAIGKIISVRWNPVMKCVEVLKSIDKKIAPEIARGFLKGYLTDVSMGCKVPYTICSVCGNKARRKSEFCLHVQRYRMQFLGNGERVFEINYEPNFHDSSAVLNGAERVAKAFMIIDEPTEGMKVAYQKVSTGNEKVARFVKLTESEMNKVASYQSAIHPILRKPEASLEKLAAPDFMQKLAELEKEVTGKLLNIVTSPDGDKTAAASQMISMIKFLTEKRFTPEIISSIGQTLGNLARSENIAPQRVFSIFLGVAELLGIELYPAELHRLLSAITDARLNSDLSISDSKDDDLYPAELAKGVKKTLEATDQLPTFNSPDDLFGLYDEGAHQTDFIRKDPLSFMESIRSGDGDGDEDDVPIHVVKIIRQTLAPMMSVRSNQPEFLLPRLSAVLSGFHPPIGGAEARHDFEILANPRSLGDMLATFAYRNYHGMRPKLVRTKMIRLAMSGDKELEKVANFWDISSHPDSSGPQGIKKRWLLLGGVPLIYGASMFQNNRRDHGRNLSDAENFIADRPGVLSAGLVLGGKPLTRVLAKGGLAAKDGAIAAKDAIKEQWSNVRAAEKPAAGGGLEMRWTKADQPGDIDKNATAVELEAITKLADSFPSGEYSAFNDQTIAKFASESGFSPEEAAALKVATILSIGGLEKESSEILEFYDIPPYAKGMFLKTAATASREEMEKAANDFINNMLIDGFINPAAMAPTLPGRMIDAFVISKLTKHLGQEGQHQNPMEQPGVPNTNKEGM